MPGRIGALRKRVIFQRETNTSDGAGGNALGWSAILGGSGEVWCEFRPERGYERLTAGRLEAPIAGTLRVRSSSETRAITTEDRAYFDGMPWQIRSITNPDQRNQWLQILVESADSRGMAS